MACRASNIALHAPAMLKPGQDLLLEFRCLKPVPGRLLRLDVVKAHALQPLQLQVHGCECPVNSCNGIHHWLYVCRAFI